MALVVITGGARSGKSAAAQRLAAERQRAGLPVHIAVFASESDTEMAARIAAHRADRPAGFSVIEAGGSIDWLGDVPDASLLVVDCLGTWLGRVMEQCWTDTAVSGTDFDDFETIPEAFADRFADGVGVVIDALSRRRGDTLVVTNEVGSGVVPAYPAGRLFRDELGRANATLVSCADAAYLAVSGRLIDLAVLPSEATWPTD